MRSPAERRTRNGLFAASVVFLHFQLVDASGYPVSLGSIFGCALLLSVVRWQPRPSLIIGCALWTLQALVVLGAEPVLTTTSQFLRTLFQALAAVTMLVVAITADRRSTHDFAPAARLLLWGLAALGGIQFL